MTVYGLDKLFIKFTLSNRITDYARKKLFHRNIKGKIQDKLIEKLSLSDVNARIFTQEYAKKHIESILYILDIKALKYKVIRQGSSLSFKDLVMRLTLFEKKPITGKLRFLKQKPDPANFFIAWRADMKLSEIPPEKTIFQTQECYDRRVNEYTTIIVDTIMNHLRNENFM